jgi:magnesium and cobalt transporter
MNALSFMRSWKEALYPGPDTSSSLIALLLKAQEKQVIGLEARLMLEGVIHMAHMIVKDVMVPATRMDMIDIQASSEELLHLVIETGHSRFPVFENNKENIIGTLMAKDLLKLQRAPELNIRALLRNTAFVPETKGLNDLLHDFQGNRNHLAIVIDEFGRVAGLITIEDVLEQIVGEIEDEFDIQEEKGDIVTMADGSYRVNGSTPLEQVVESFQLSINEQLNEERFNTIGGYIAHAMGHVPKRGESLTISGVDFAVMHTKGGAVRWFRVRNP